VGCPVRTDPPPPRGRARPPAFDGRPPTGYINAPSIRGVALFPLRDENPTAITPVVTVVLILGNVAVWLYVQGMGFDAGVLVESVCRFGAIPGHVTGQAGGAEVVELAPGLPPCELGGPRFGSVVTSMFLHGSWLHLIANMWFLWLFGNNIEDSMGHGRFAAFYLLTGVLATAAHIFSAPDSLIPVVGASGAISGVMGGYLLLYPKVRIQTLFIFVFILRIIAVPAWFVLILWFALQLLSGYADPVSTAGIAVWAHVGGFVAGVLLVKPFENPALVEARRRSARTGRRPEA
jgi:membrane associated rhomboid family serine protease